MQHPKITHSARISSANLVGAGTYDVPYPIFDWSEIVVQLDGKEVTGWSGSPSTDAGVAPTGKISFAEPLTGKVTVTSRMAPKRDHDFIEGAGLPVKAINNDLDRLAAMDQELARDLKDARASLLAEVDALLDRAKQIDVALSRTVRSTVPLSPVPVGCDKDVLSWRKGQIVNQSIDELLARAIAVRQERPEPISLCDIERGVFIGCPGDPVQLWECFVMPAASDWPFESGDECKFGEPLRVIDLCQFPTGLGPQMRSVACETENGPATACIYTQIH